MPHPRAATALGSPLTDRPSPFGRLRPAPKDTKHPQAIPASAGLPPTLHVTIRQVTQPLGPAPCAATPTLSSPHTHTTDTFLVTLIWHASTSHPHPRALRGRHAYAPAPTCTRPMVLRRCSARSEPICPPDLALTKHSSGHSISGSTTSSRMPRSSPWGTLGEGDTDY